MFYQLPPVGNPVRLKASRNSELLLQGVFRPYSPRYFNSGTAALAASVLASVNLKGTPDPEVILPAYGCPDLVSAIRYAGAKPVLVDLEADRPWMDLEQVTSSITENTTAIIAASFCGIPERLDALGRIAEQAAVLLIEDSAQLFPGSIAEANWQGDLVVLSFGRGKPVNLLGGGAVLYRDPELGGLLPRWGHKHSAEHLLHMKARLYNLMSSPYLYWIPQGLPFLHLGETRYHPLGAIGPMSPARCGLLATNVCNYMNIKGLTPSIWYEVAGEGDGKVWSDLPRLCEVPPQMRLLRYPLLVQPQWRGRLFRRLRQAGLGPSIMYPAPLPRIPGLENLQEGRSYPAAEAFASRILTVPTHARVRCRDLRKIVEVFGKNYH